MKTRKRRKTEGNLTLKGCKFELRLSNIARQGTTKITPGDHDHREEALAYVWTGTLEIYSIYESKGIVHPFLTESFWPENVRGLDLKDILFLCVCPCLYGIEFKNEEARKDFIDYLASRLLVARSFGCTNPEEGWNFHIRPFDFRFDTKDGCLKRFGLFTWVCLELKHGLPGSVSKKRQK